MKEIPYGFEVKQASLVVNKFDIFDLAKDKKILNFRYGGFLKPKTTIYDLNNDALLEIKKKSIFGFSWEIMKKGVKIVELKHIGGLCSGRLNISTEEGEYTVLSVNSVTNKIIDSTGNEVVRLQRTKGPIKTNYLVEVEESFDPLIALGLSVIFIYLYIQSQKIAI
jgi:hypothetical protein